MFNNAKINKIFFNSKEVNVININGNNAWTASYRVTFLSDESIISTQTVSYNNYAQSPQTPIYDGYIFDGWTVNFVDKVDVETYPITETTVFYAKKATAYNVCFRLSSDNIIYQQVRKNGYANIDASYIPEDTDYLRFNGWRAIVYDENFNIISQTQVSDLSNFPITSDVEFRPNMIQYAVDVKYKDADGQIVFSEIVELGSTPVGPTYEPTIDGYIFHGWSVDGTNIIDIDKYVITRGTVFVPIFRAIGTIKYGTLSIDGTTSGTIYASEVVNGKIYLRRNSNLAVYDVESDTIENTYTIPFSPYGMLVYGEKVYFCGSKGNFAYFDIKTASMSGNIGISIDKYFYDMYAYGDNIYITGSSGCFSIYNISSNTFSGLIATPHGENYLSPSIVYNNKLYIGDDAGCISYYDLNTSTFSSLIETPIASNVYKNIDTLYIVNDKLYLAGNVLCIYDLINNTFSEIYKPVGNSSGTRIMDIICVGNTMYLVGLSGKFISYDMETNTVIDTIKIANFYKQVTSTSSQTKSIYSISYFNYKLYIFGESCNYAIYGI